MKLREFITNQTLTESSFPTDKATIESLLETYDVTRYSIHPDGTVDVHESVSIYGDFTEFPVKFGRVDGPFSCAGCENLTSLEGAPYYVGGYFSCYKCPQLLSLDHAPKTVKGTFDVAQCPKISSLVSFDTQMEGDLYCDWWSIKTGGIGLILTGCTDLWASADDEPFKIIEKYLGRPEDIFECQAELINAGYEEYAQL